jgi:hypothetical protein
VVAVPLHSSWSGGSVAGAPLPSAPLPVAKVVGILMPDGLTRSIGGSSIEAS